MSNGSVENPVIAVQQWMEKEIIGRGFCPPLIRLARGYRNDEGNIDWANLSKEVVIDDFTHLNPDSNELLQTSGRVYTDFIYRSIEGTAPLTRVIIFPDFRDNPEFDSFLHDTKMIAFNVLTSTSEGRAFAKLAFTEIANVQKTPAHVVADVFRQGHEWVAVQVIEGSFNTINFYGRRVTDEDVEGFPDTEGSVDRYKVLARAPYYIMQVANALRGSQSEIAPSLYTPHLRKRNTTIALGINLDEYEEIMRNFREQASTGSSNP